MWMRCRSPPVHHIILLNIYFGTLMPWQMLNYCLRTLPIPFNGVASPFNSTITFCDHCYCSFSSQQWHKINNINFHSNKVLNYNSACMIVRNRQLCVGRTRSCWHYVIGLLSVSACYLSSTPSKDGKIRVPSESVHERFECDAREILVDDYIDVNHHQPSIINRFVWVSVAFNWQTAAAVDYFVTLIRHLFFYPFQFWRESSLTMYEMLLYIENNWLLRLIFMHIEFYVCSSSDVPIFLRDIYANP